MLFSSVLLLFGFISPILSLPPLLLDFTDKNFNSLNTSLYKIYDINWNELSFSNFQIINNCLDYSIIGGKLPDNSYIFGKVNPVSYFSISMLRTDFPVYSIQISLTLLYFGAFNSKAMLFTINSTGAGGKILTTSSTGIQTKVTNDSLQCATEAKIFTTIFVTFISTSITPTYWNITLSGLNTEGGFGFRDLSITMKYCDSTCESCTSPTSCKTCSSPATRVSLCVCNLQGYSWTPCENPELCSKKCEPCPSGCASCDENACLSCTNSSDFIYGRTCVSECPNGYYGLSSQCLPCSPPCLSCRYNDSYCESCTTGYNLLSNQCLDQCPTQYFEQSGICLPCESPCLECSNSADNCTSCLNNINNSFILFDNQCLLECPLTYFTTLSHQCVECPYSCLRCKNDTNLKHLICLECVVYFTLLEGECINGSCPSNYYKDNSICEKCDDSCLECEGPTSMSCLACAPGLILFEKQCLTSCPNNYFQNYSQCLKCDDSCEGCTALGPSKCVSCNANYYLNDGECVESCPDSKIADEIRKICKLSVNCPVGYFLDNKTESCLLCDKTCHKCENTKDYCVECPIFQFLYNHTCVSVCPDGTYVDTNLKICGSCNYFCYKCSGPLFSDCTECTNNLYLDNNACIAECSSSSYQNEKMKKCINCDKSCKTCSGESFYECESCNDKNQALNNGTCVDECPADKFVDINQNNTCQSCQENCKKCASLYECAECQQNYFLNDEKKCQFGKNISFFVKDINNPGTFELVFSAKWEYIRKNIKDILALYLKSSSNFNNIIPEINFMIVNSTFDENLFIIKVNYSNSFNYNAYYLIFNISINYSNSGNEYFLTNSQSKILLNQYQIHSEQEYYNTKQQKYIKKPEITTFLEYTDDPTKLLLHFSYIFESMKTNISKFSSISIEGLKSKDFNYSIYSANSNSENFEISIKINKSIALGPKLTYIIDIPEDLIIIENVLVISNKAEISLFDYIILSEGEKNMIENAATQSKATSYVATSAAYANTAFASGTPMFLQGLMLTELIYLIKYIDIKYPPNVLEIFKSNNQLTTFFFFYKFEENQGDQNTLPLLFRYYGVSPYFLENNGEIICKNLFILTVVFILIELVSENKSKSFVIKFLKFIYSIVVWELVLFFMLVFWQKFVFFTFSNLSFHSNSFNSIINVIFASLFLFFEVLFLAHIFLILKVISSIKQKKIRLENFTIKEHHILVDQHENSSIDESCKLKNQISPLPSDSKSDRNNNSVHKLFFEQSFTDSIRTNVDEKKNSAINPLNLSAFSPSLSPSKFKKTAVLPEENAEKVITPSINPKKCSVCKAKLKKIFEKIKYFCLSLRIVKYFYFPKNEDLFLKQYEFMHLDLLANNIYQTHYVWFDYLRQTILSILATAFDFHPFPQIFLINLVNLFFILYFIFAVPYKSKFLFYCCLISEIITESALISCLGLAILDLNLENKLEMRLFFGWIIVSANLALLYWLCFAGIIKILIMLYEKRKMKKILAEESGKEKNLT